MGDETVHTTIYRSKYKPGLYLYLAEADQFEVVPAEIMKGLGVLEKAMALDLHTGRPLAHNDVGAVMHNLKEHGFHIQLPPKDFDLEEQIKTII